MLVERVSIWKVTIILTAILALLWLNYVVIDITPTEIRQMIYQAGWLAPVAYLVIYSIRPLVLFPASIFSMVGGLAFGVLFGGLLALTGATLSAVVAFFVTRKFGHKAVQFKEKDKIEQYRQKFESKGFLYILMLRLVPVINFDFISYTAGLARVSLKDFVRATVIGIIPGTIVHSFVGASIAEGSSTKLIIAGFLLVVMLLIPVIWNQQLLQMIERMKTN